MIAVANAAKQSAATVYTVMQQWQMERNEMRKQRAVRQLLQRLGYQQGVLLARGMQWWRGALVVRDMELDIKAPIQG